MPAPRCHTGDETDLSGHLEYRFERDGTGTRVTMSCAVKPASVYGWLAVPLRVLGRKNSYAEQLPQLKRAMEGG